MIARYFSEQRPVLRQKCDTRSHQFIVIASVGPAWRRKIAHPLTVMVFERNEFRAFRLPVFDCSIDTRLGAKQEIGNPGRILSPDVEQEEVKRQDISITARR